MSISAYPFMTEDHMDKLYNSRNPFVKFTHVSRLNSIAKKIPLKSESKILDAGCGEGHLIEKLYRMNSSALYYGIDIRRQAVEKTRVRCPYAELEVMNLVDISFDDEFFDTVICTEVLEHLYEYQTVIKELERVLRKRGYLIVTFPNETLWTISRFLLGRKPVKVPDHINSFNPDRIKSLVRMKLISHVGLPFGLPFNISLGCLMKFEK
jgi:2-polyprenyl-3-methyl-5-hydroxy-6-metoxy-1,4-benzoquinol methylase